MPKTSLMLSVIFLTLASCGGTKEVHYVRYQQSQPKQEHAQASSQKRVYETARAKQKSTSECRYLYSFYEKCYAAGIAKNVNWCADFTEAIYYELSGLDSDAAAAVSVYCGVACTTAAKRQGMMSYASFGRDYCT